MNYRDTPNQSPQRFCLCDHLQQAHVLGKRCHGTVYDVVGNYSCHCDEYIENAVCVCGMTRYAHRRHYDKEPGGTHFGGCEKFIPLDSVPREKPVTEPLETVEQDPTSIRFSLLELD